MPNGEASTSLWEEENGRPIFHATMSWDIPHDIVCYLLQQPGHKTDRREKDKLQAEICGINGLKFYLAVQSWSSYCAPQYTPNKPAKYGMKIWAACDAKSNYAWNMQVCTGKLPGGTSEKNQGRYVVLEMSESQQGRNIMCDNFFTSYRLGDDHQKRKLTMLGTISRPLHFSIFAFTEKATVVSYFPKWNTNVLILSTMHTDASLRTREDKKPEIILDYNSTKGVVDNLDKVTAMYGFSWFLTTLWTCQCAVDWNQPAVECQQIFTYVSFSWKNSAKHLSGSRPAWYSAPLAMIGKVKLRSPKQHPVDTCEKKGKRCQFCPSREDSKKYLLIEMQELYLQTNSNILSIIWRTVKVLNIEL